MEESRSTRLPLLTFLVAPCLLEIFSLLVIGFIEKEHWPIVTPTYLLLLLLFIAQHEVRLIRWILIALLSFRFLYVLYEMVSRVSRTHMMIVFKHFPPSVVPLYIALGIIVTMIVLYGWKYDVNGW